MLTALHFTETVICKPDINACADKLVFTMS